jgi:hypothetical protein
MKIVLNSTSVKKTNRKKIFEQKWQGCASEFVKSEKSTQFYNLKISDFSFLCSLEYNEF